jgi:hypothetical protein
VNAELLRRRLQLAMREVADGPKIIVHLKNGQRLHGKITVDHAPTSWVGDVLTITQRRATETHEHLIDMTDISAVTVLT